MSEKLNVVGKNVKMVRGFEKVTGKATYNNDVRLHGMLRAKILRSPHANAEIVEMDVGAAESLPGVKLVMSHKNFGQIFGPYVYYVGAEVAVVVAETEEIAEAALDLIQVKYRVNPFVIDPEKAMEEGAPKAFPNVPKGILIKPDMEMVEAPSDYPNVNTWQYHKRFSEKNEKGLFTKKEIGDTEGFGDVPIAERTFEVLSRCDGKRASINGKTQVRAGVIRPEVIVAVPGGGRSREPGQETGGTLGIGTRVRGTREPFFGRVGVVSGLPEEPVELETEAWVRVFEVTFEDERALVPRSNVEAI